MKALATVFVLSMVPTASPQIQTKPKNWIMKAERVHFLRPILSTK